MFTWTEDPTRDTSHRPWPIPNGPWVMAQRWNDLLFAHWPVPHDVLRPLVPATLPLDVFDGTAWVTIAPFTISHLRPRFVPPLPGISFFPELNVRTYVTLDDKPGVFFFSLDAASWLAVMGARTFYHLPYFHAWMIALTSDDRWTEYQSRRRGVPAGTADFRARYGPGGPIHTSERGTIEYWLTERYCLYATDSASRVYRAEIHHEPWPLQPAIVEIWRNTMADAAGIPLAGAPAHLSFTRRIDVVVWPPEVARR